jgi:hypothetical protein
MFISHVGEEQVTTPEEFRRAIEAAGDVWELRLAEPAEPSRGPASAKLRVAPP